MKTKFNPDNVKVIVGLGNPGREYTNTYHNAGAQAILYLRKKMKSTFFKKHMVLVLWERQPKSRAYMNEAGSVIKSLLKKSDVLPHELMIIQDDSDLPLGGKPKLSFGRSSGGHKGVESIIKSLGTKNFWRFRIGIRKETSGAREKAGAFVLSKVTAADRELLEQQFQELANVLTACTGT